MARRKEFDKDEVIVSAMDLLWRNGYEGTSIRELIAETGISSSSLYAEFGDKNEIYQAALAHYRKIEYGQIKALLDRSGSARIAIARLFENLADSLLTDDASRGSFTLNAAIELGGKDEATAEQLRQHFDDLSLLVEDMLVQAIKDGEITPKHEPRPLAQFILHNLYSLATFVKVYPDRSRMENIANITLAVLD